MKNLVKRGLAMLLAVVLCIGILPAVQLTADAQNVEYITGSTSDYSNVILNWGERGETATYLSPNAESFYEDVSYSYLSTLDGSATVSGVPGSELYIALQELMASNHTTETSYGETRYLYAFTDCQNNDTELMTCFYSGRSIGPDWDSGSTWNREHSWPKSKTEAGDCGNSDRGEVADIMMLRPASSSINSSRGNKAYGESSGFYYPNETSDEKYDVRGDAARIVLYVYVRWGNTEWMWGSDGVIENLDILLNWMEEDPVDTWELGRNDSVESITGTRNVFVDYPELAFLLFGEDVPSDMTTPSGEGYSSYTITATVNNPDYGSVTVNGNTIVAEPNVGYAVSGYTVVEGSATVTRNGNVFKVAAASDCTIQINFEARDIVTLTFVENGRTTTTLSAHAGDIVTLPERAGYMPEGYSFVGWVSQAIEDSVQTPAYAKAGSQYTATEDTTLYAVYSYTVAGAGTEYKLVTDVSQLVVGNKIVIVSAEHNYALSTNQKNNNRGAVVITKNDNGTISFETTAGVAELVLGEGTVDGTYSFYTGTGYLYAASSSSNYLRTQTTLNDNGSFAITVGATGTCSVIAQGTNTRNQLRFNYNNGTPLFACYKSGQTAVSLYAETTGGATYYTNTYVCDHEYQAVVTAPTCTEQGYTTYTCTVCGDSYVDDYVDATGHSWGEWVQTKAPTVTEEGEETRTCSTCGATETRPVEKLAQTNPFTDVPESKFYHDPVLWAVEKEITTGKTETTFAPDANCTRAQVVVFLWRAAGRPEPTDAANPFTDVNYSKDSDFYKAIMWAVEQGITTGKTTTTFAPDATVTREQFVVFLWRYMGKPEAANTTNPFMDLTRGPNTDFYKAIMWAVESGVTTGKTETTFAPSASCTRGQVVTFLYRAMGEQN